MKITTQVNTPLTDSFSKLLIENNFTHSVKIIEGEPLVTFNINYHTEEQKTELLTMIQFISDGRIELV